MIRQILRAAIITIATLAAIAVVGITLIRIFITPDARRASGGNDFHPFVQACRQYAIEHDGWLPPLDPEPGRLMADHHLMHNVYGLTGKDVTAEYDDTVPVREHVYGQQPEFLDDANLIDDHSWWYLGYHVTNEIEGRAYLLGYLRAAFTDGIFGETLPLPDTAADHLEPVTRLRLDDLARQQVLGGKSFILSPGADIPLLIERPGHYPPYTGAWVCYLDGHSEFIDYPGKWPMTEEFIQGLQRLEDSTALTAAPSTPPSATPPD